jgi:hypothetical protein
MLVQRRSILTGLVRTRELDITEEQLEAWQSGALIQDVMPHLSDSDREFLINGVTEEEWTATFGEDV